MTGKRHGKSYSRTYQAYNNMVARCTRESYHNYSQYGGKGIKVAERWLGLNGFKNFLEDNGEVPDGLSLDRYPDPCGNYEPGNTRWATSEQQAKNKCKKKYQFEGKELTLLEWSEETGIPCYRLASRFYRQGWSLERTLTTPPRSLDAK